MKLRLRRRKLWWEGFDSWDGWTFGPYKTEIAAFEAVTRGEVPIPWGKRRLIWK